MFTFILNFFINMFCFYPCVCEVTDDVSESQQDFVYDGSRISDYSLVSDGQEFLTADELEFPVRYDRYMNPVYDSFTDHNRIGVPMGLKMSHLGVKKDGYDKFLLHTCPKLACVLPNFPFDFCDCIFMIAVIAGYCFTAYMFINTGYFEVSIVVFILILSIIVNLPVISVDPSDALASIGFNKSRYKNQFQRKDMRVIDGNTMVNKYRIVKYRLRAWHESFNVYLYGSTVSPIGLLPFPIYCDEYQFCTVVCVELLRLDPFHRRQLLAGRVTPQNRDIFERMWGPPPPRALAFLLSGKIPYLHIASAYLYSLNSYAWIVAAVSVFLAASVFCASRFSKDVTKYYHFLLLASPVYEEFIKFFVGGPLFGLIEMSIKLQTMSFSFHLIFPLLLHCLTDFIGDYKHRVIIHFLYNLVVLIGANKPSLFATIDFTSDVFLEKVELVAHVAELCLKIKNKNPAGVLLTLATKATQYKNICQILFGEDFMDASDFSNFVPNFSDSVFDREDDETVCLMPQFSKDEDEPENRSAVLFFIDKVKRLLPKSISHSPTLAKLSAFLVLIFSSQYITSMAIFQQISKYFVFPEILEKANILDIVASMFYGVYGGFQRMFESGNWKDFFDMPKDVAFMKHSADILYQIPKAETDDEIVLLLARIRSLIDSRMYCVNSVDISRRMELLRKYVLGKESFLKALKCRMPPMVIWLLGLPGTGKTEFIKTVVGLVSVENRWKRFAGDTLNYSIFDKYPVSTGAHPEAKVLVVNDIPDSYTEFPKQDLIPLDVLLQRVVDSYPLDFRCAAVEDKGVVFNNLEVMILTANYYNYVVPSDTDKLTRRIESGVLFEMNVQKDGKPMKYAEFSKLPQGERNSCSRFTVLEPICRHKHIKFEKTTRSLNTPEAVAYILRRLREHQANAQKSLEMFTDSNEMCDCGAALVMHRMSSNQRGLNTFSFEYEDCKWLNDAWQSFTPHCDNFIARENDSRKLANRIIYYDESLQACVDKFTAIKWSWFIVSCLYNVYYLNFLMLFLCSSTFYFFNALVDFCDRAQLEELYSIFLGVLLKADNFFDVSPTMILEHKAQKVFLEFKLWWRKNMKYVAGIMAFGSGAVLLKCISAYLSKDSLTALSSPIFAQDVHPDSMVTINHRQEANFEESTRREWGKKEGVINLVTLAKVGTSIVDLEVIVRSQLHRVLMTLCDTKSHAHVMIFMISSDWFAINKHYLFNEFGIEKTSHFSLTVKTQVFTFNTGDAKKSSKVEWLMFRHDLPFVVSKAAFNWFPEEECDAMIEVMRVSPESSVAAIAYPVKAVINGAQYAALQWPDKVSKGDCMSVIIGKYRGGAAIVGFLSYGCLMRNGEFTAAGCTLVSRKTFMEFVETSPEPIVGDNQLVGVPLELTTVALQADLRNISDNAHLEALGTEPGSTNSFRSAIRKTQWYDFFYPKLTKPYSYPRRVAGVTLEGEYKSSFTHTFNNFGMGDDFPLELAFKAADSYLEDAFPQSFIDSKQIKASPLTLSEAFFGAPDMQIGRMPFDTSCGPLLKRYGIRNKYDLFAKKEGDDKFEFNSLFRDQVDAIIKSWKNGIVTLPVAEFVNKDEVRSTEKLEDNKVRLFANMDAPFNTPSKMYLMSLITIFLRYCKRTECYGGMNAGSSEWDVLGTWLFENGFSQIDMDFSCFDSSHGMKVFRVVAYFMYRFALRAGYTSEAALITYFCVRSCAIQIMKYINTWFIKYGGLPSGFILTLVFNSIVNSILMRMAYEILVGNMRDFQKHVRVATVGDDNSSGVSDLVIDRYNMMTIAPLYAKWGYKVTGADKAEVTRKTVPKEELQFLKRKWVFNPDLKGYSAPIETDSIYKSLCFEGKKLGVTSVQRLCDVAQGAQREAFLHGRVFFSKFQSELVEVTSLPWIPMPLVMLKYEDLVQEYEEKRFRTFDC
jgi:hypothetical protein